MTQVSEENMPPIVYDAYAFLLDNTDTVPVVERQGTGRIRLVHQSDRVRMTISFQHASRRWVWKKSTLHVDGAPQPLATSWEMYVAIFKDPDNGRETYVPEGAKKAQIPVSRDVDEQHTPQAIQSVANQLRKLSNPETVEQIRVSIAGSREYLLTVRNKTGKQIVLFFDSGPGNSWRIVQMMIVSPTGHDVTGFESGFVDDVLLEMLGAQSRNAQVSALPSAMRSTDNVPTNSVQVRKTTVFRI